MEIIFVVGYIATGKTYYTNSIKRENDVVIELGNIVREITKQQSRVFDNNLDDVIYKRCLEIIQKNTSKRIIIVAPRSPYLMEKLINITNNHEIHYLDVLSEIREQRFIESHRIKDINLSYQDAVRGDLILGLDVLIEKLLKGKYGKFKIINNY